MPRSSAQAVRDLQAKHLRRIAVVGDLTEHSVIDTETRSANSPEIIRRYRADQFARAHAEP